MARDLYFLLKSVLQKLLLPEKQEKFRFKNVNYVVEVFDYIF